MGNYITESADSLIEIRIIEKATETHNSVPTSISQPSSETPNRFQEMLKLLDMEDLAVLEKTRMFETEGADLPTNKKLKWE